MSITDFTFNNTHFQVKMVKKFKSVFFSRFFNMGYKTCPINHDKLIGPAFIGFGDKIVFFVIFFSLQEYVLKMKHLKFLTRHYSGASVSEVPNE